MTTSSKISTQKKKKDSRSRIDSTSLQIKTSVDQDSTKPFTEATQRKRNRRFNTLKSPL